MVTEARVGLEVGRTVLLHKEHIYEVTVPPCLLRSVMGQIKQGSRAHLELKWTSQNEPWSETLHNQSFGLCKVRIYTFR